MKTITVKGAGNVSVKPDYVVLSMSLETRNHDYETAMREAASRIDRINKSLATIGFEKESVKTTDFNVRTDYESKKDRNGNYYRVFNGYVVYHRLKVSFDFDTKVLSKALGTIAGCIAEPELSISFTVKEPSAVNEVLLKSAAENAKKKAEILCEASGAKLGELVNIDYNWGELNIYSRTRYDTEDTCMKAPYSHGESLTKFHWYAPLQRQAKTSDIYLLKNIHTCLDKPGKSIKYSLLSPIYTSNTFRVCKYLL